MKVGYWILLTAVVALTLVPGLAWGQIITSLEMLLEEDNYGEPLCEFYVETDMHVGEDAEDAPVNCDRDYYITELSPELVGLEYIVAGMNAGDLRDGDLASFELASDATLYVRIDGRGDPGPCFDGWTETELVFDCTEADADWFILSQDFSAGATFTMCQNEGGAMYTIIAAGAGSPPPPPVTISGSGHRLLVGQDLDLAVEPGDIEPTAYEWFKDGEAVDSETEPTLTILSLTTDDTGDYSCLVTYDEGGGDAAYAEAEPSYYVWVTETALPLAGGLGLALMAGACALAGAVSIRRKK